MNWGALDWGILGPALIAGLLVLATHVPLGTQVLDRGIVFIDLAIAQIAGLGVIAADAFGMAEGGFGVIETCAANVSEDGKAWAGELGVFDDRLLPGLDRLAGAISGAGAIAIAQLFHGGVRADPALTGVPAWSASAFEEAGLRVPRAATEVDLTAVIARFGEAAARCSSCGRG